MQIFHRKWVDFGMTWTIPPQLPCAMTPAWSAPVPGSCRPWPVPSPGRAPARPCTACSCGGCGGTSSGTAPQSVPVKRGSSGRWRLVSGPWWQKYGWSDCLTMEDQYRENSGLLGYGATIVKHIYLSVVFSLPREALVRLFSNRR